jgi:hypothetical protein
VETDEIHAMQNRALGVRFREMNVQPELFPTKSLIDDLLLTPAEAEVFLPQAEKLVEFIRQKVASSESLTRYREVRKRMGEPKRAIFSEPNFPVVIHVA